MGEFQGHNVKSLTERMAEEQRKVPQTEGMQRLSIASLLVVPLSLSIFCFAPTSFSIMISVLILLVPFGFRSCCMTVRPFQKLGYIPNLYELFYFVFQGLTIFCVVTVTVMISAIFGPV